MEKVILYFKGAKGVERVELYPIDAATALRDFPHEYAVTEHGFAAAAPPAPEPALPAPSGTGEGNAADSPANSPVRYTVAEQAATLAGAERVAPPISSDPALDVSRGPGENIPGATGAPLPGFAAADQSGKAAADAGEPLPSENGDVPVADQGADAADASLEDETIGELVVKHRGRGKYAVYQGDEVLAENLTKDEAEKFAEDRKAPAA